MTAAHHPAWPLPLGTVLDGRFALVGILGQGATGTVYRAVDRAGAHPVAVKVGAGEGADPGRIRSLIRQEAACLARVCHPRIVGLRETVRIGSLEALVLDHLPGRTLSRILADRRGVPLGDVAAARILHDLGEALATLHRAGFVHGDVKPGNVVVAPDGHATLIDFGTARPAEEAAANPDRGDTRTDVTPAFAAPGVLAGEAPDPRDDVYSLALLALATMTGQPPRRVGEIAWEARRRGRLTPPGIAAARWVALRRGLAADRAARPRHADAFAARLHHPALSDRLVAWGDAWRRARGRPSPAVRASS